MNQTFTSGMAFLAATIAVFGLLSVVDQSFGSKPSAGRYPVHEIKGGVGAVTPVGQEHAGAGDPLKADKKDKPAGSR